MSTGVFRRRFLPPPPLHPQALAVFAQPDTLVADYGTLTLAGQSATLNLNVVVAYGTLTLAGQAALFPTDIIAGYGTLTLTGGAATFGVATLMAADYGSLTLAGQGATFALNAVVDYGTLTLTGSNIPLTFASDPGALALQAKDASFYIDLSAGKGDLTLTGADLNAQFNAVFEHGTLYLTGSDDTNFEVRTPRGASGSRHKKKIERKEVRLRSRTIEIEKDGKRKKVDYIDRFAPPPPPPPLELIPDWLFPDRPTAAPAPQPEPIATPLLGYDDPLKIVAEIEAAEDERDAMAIIEQIGDPALDELNDFLAKLAA